MAKQTPATPPEPAMKPSELVIAAADYIEAHGWIQGNFYDDAGGTCALGAMHMAGRQFGGDWQAQRAAFAEAEKALESVAEELHGEPISVIEFNNTVAEGRADVVALMWKSAAKLQEQGR